MNNVTLKSLVLVSSIISIMSIEELFNNGRFNGPVYEPNSLSWDVDSHNCVCCKGCTK